MIMVMVMVMVMVTGTTIDALIEIIQEMIMVAGIVSMKIKIVV